LDTCDKRPRRESRRHRSCVGASGDCAPSSPFRVAFQSSALRDQPPSRRAQYSPPGTGSFDGETTDRPNVLSIEIHILRNKRVRVQIRTKFETVMARDMKWLLIGVRVGACPVRGARTIGSATQGMAYTRLTPWPFLWIVTAVTFLLRINPGPRPWSRAVHMKGADHRPTQCHTNCRPWIVDVAVIPDNTAAQSYLHNPGMTQFTLAADIRSFTFIFMSRMMTNCRCPVPCSMQNIWI
jgi:hypothetical protein